MDAVVQLLRNGLCCIKDLGLLTDTFLWDPNVTLRYYDLPEPLHKTTPLEVLISIWQLYALLSTTTSGWKMFWSSIGKYRRVVRLLTKRASNVIAFSPADRFIDASLIKEAKFALRSIYIGLNVFFIGTGFFWLTGNSWHVTETSWIGGLPALIQALTVMELCLIPLLWFMWKDTLEQWDKANRMENLAHDMMQSDKTVWSVEDLGLSSMETLTLWLPFWDAGVGVLEACDEIHEEKLMAAEKAKLTALLEPFSVKREKTKSKDKKAESSMHQETLRSKAQELLGASRVTRWGGYREFVYLIINALAFYGYLVGIVVYYWDDEQKQPVYIKHLLLNMENDAADWNGNFLGDFMWTIEPIIILSSPLIFRILSPKPIKVKVD
jgi:hypothetical protein